MTPNHDISQPSFIRLLVGTFGLALLLRIAMTAAFQGLSSPQGDGMGLDPVDYENFAYQMSIGNGYVLSDGVPSARRTPGTSLSLLPVYWVFGRSYLAARIWWCFISAATVVATGWLGALLVSRRVGIVAALLLTFFPGHMHLSMHFSSEVPFAFAAVVATALLVQAGRRQSYLYAMLSGLVWGASILIRGQMIFAAPVALLLIACTQEGRRLFGVYTTAITTPILVIAPWILRNYLVFGKPTMALLLSSYTFWGAHNDVVLKHPESQGLWVFHVDEEHVFRGTEIEREATAWRYSREWLEDHWGDMPWLTVMKLWRLITPFERTNNRLVYWAFAIAWTCTAPAFVIGWKRLFAINRPATLIISLPLIATLITTIVFYGCIRFRDAVCPLFILCSAVVFTEYTAVLFARRTKKVSQPDLESSTV